MIPICVKHGQEMTCAENSVLVQYPGAQYIFSGDKFACRADNCDNIVILRASRPIAEGWMPTYQSMRVQADYSVWNQ